MFAACAAPVALRQRLQWQYLKPASGGLISKRTAPHKQLPAMDFCSISILLYQSLRTTTAQRRVTHLLAANPPYDFYDFFLLVTPRTHEVPILT